MGILRKGCKTKRSLSPVIMQEAFAETANSRNLLSLGSRQSVIVSDISLKIESRLKSVKIPNLVSLEIYLSNYGRRNTSKNLLYVGIPANIFSVWLAFFFCFTEHGISEKGRTYQRICINNKKAILHSTAFQGFLL